MDCLLDTNIILRNAEPAHPMHEAAATTVARLISEGNNLLLIPQNIIEFWSVATRPAANNGLGFTAEQTETEVASLTSMFVVIPDSPAIFDEWRRLVVEHSVLGKQVHDTRIVAAMIVHGVDSLLTFNTDDFKQFSDIHLVEPTVVD